MDYEFEGQLFGNPEEEVGAHYPLVYRLDVFLGGLLQFAIHIEATPAQILGNPSLGGTGYDAYPGLSEQYRAVAEAKAQRVLEKWEPITDHSHRPLELYRWKWPRDEAD